MRARVFVYFLLTRLRSLSRSRPFGSQKEKSFSFTGAVHSSQSALGHFGEDSTCSKSALSVFPFARKLHNSILVVDDSVRCVRILSAVSQTSSLRAGRRMFGCAMSAVASCSQSRRS